MGVAFGKYHNINGFGDVVVANPSVIHGQVEVVVVADEIVVGADRDAHSFLQLTVPSLVEQGDVDFHFRERHDDRFVEAFGDFLGLVGGLPFAKEVLVTLGKQQVVSSGLKNLDDVAAELERVDEVGLGAAPVWLADEFLERTNGRIVVSRQTIVHAERCLGEMTVELRPSHAGQEGQKKK